MQLNLANIVNTAKNLENRDTEIGIWNQLSSMSKLIKHCHKEIDKPIVENNNIAMKAEPKQQRWYQKWMMDL